jgi:hypothetical protein
VVSCAQRPPLLLVQDAVELGRDVEAEAAVDVDDGRLRRGDEIAVVDDGLRHLRVARQHVERVVVGMEGLVGQDAERSLDRRLVPTRVAPGLLEQLQQARDRVARVTQQHDEARIREGLEEALDAPAERRVLAEMDPVAAVRVQLAPHALLVERHETAAGARRALVDVVEVEVAHVRRHDDPEPRGHRERQDEVVLLGLREAGPVHLLRRREPCPRLQRLHTPAEAAAEHALVEPADRADGLLLDQRRQEHLVEAEERVATRVHAQEAVQERGAAARVPDDEHRPPDLDPAQSREQDPVEEEADGVDGRHDRHDQQEHEEQLPPRPRVLLVPREAQHPEVRRRVEVEDHSVVPSAAAR